MLERKLVFWVRAINPFFIMRTILTNVIKKYFNFFYLKLKFLKPENDVSLHTSPMCFTNLRCYFTFRVDRKNFTLLSFPFIQFTVCSWTRRIENRVNMFVSYQISSVRVYLIEFAVLFLWFRSWSFLNWFIKFFSCLKRIHRILFYWV